MPIRIARCERRMALSRRDFLQPFTRSRATQAGAAYVSEAVNPDPPMVAQGFYSSARPHHKTQCSATKQKAQKCEHPSSRLSMLSGQGATSASMSRHFSKCFGPRGSPRRFLGRSPLPPQGAALRLGRPNFKPQTAAELKDHIGFWPHL